MSDLSFLGEFSPRQTIADMRRRQRRRSIPDEVVDDLRRVHPIDVVEKLASKARERDKWSCVACDSSDGLNVTPRRDRAKCYACGGSWDALGLVAAAEGLDLSRDFIDVCRALGRLAGVLVDVEGEEYIPRVRRSPARPKPAKPAVSSDELEAARDLLDELYNETGPLDDEALMYLERRGVSYATAVASGLRSWVPNDWVRVAAADERLTHLIGLRDDKGGLHPYWCHEPSQTALVTPYRDARGRVVSVQLRAVEKTGSKVKDWSLRKVSDVGAEAGAFVPSSVDLSSAPVVYVVEGTLDALSVLECGRAVVGAPGAGSWRDEWSRRHLSACELVIVLADADKAGEAFARRVASSVRSTCPGVEVEAFAPTREGLDANDALSDGNVSLARELAKIEGGLR